MQHSRGTKRALIDGQHPGAGKSESLCLVYRGPLAFRSLCKSFCAASRVHDNIETHGAEERRVVDDNSANPRYAWLTVHGFKVQWINSITQGELHSHKRVKQVVFDAHTLRQEYRRTWRV
jgi:hypothetical protein